MKYLISLLAAVSLLAGCGGADVSPQLPVVSSGVEWKQQPDIQGTHGNYLSVLIKDSSNIVVYSNFNGPDNTNDAKLYESTGSFAQVGNTKIAFDLKGYYLRTFAVQQGAGFLCYGVFRLEGNGPKAYGNGSYYPHFGYSLDCKNWIVSDNKMWLGNSNSNTLHVDESKTVLDTVNPINNRFVVYDDSFAKLGLFYSADGTTWKQYEKDGKSVDLWPASLAQANPQFGSIVKTPFGWHGIFANYSNAANAATEHMHLFSCDGLTWAVLETQAPTINSTKGTTLVYEKSTGDIHALSNGKHMTTKAKSYPCK